MEAITSRHRPLSHPQAKYSLNSDRDSSLPSVFPTIQKMKFTAVLAALSAVTAVNA
jgi:hypothetical protein